MLFVLAFLHYGKVDLYVSVKSIFFPNINYARSPEITLSNIVSLDYYTSSSVQLKQRLKLAFM